MTDPFSRLLFGQIRATLPAEAVVIARKPTVIALFGERRASIWPKHADDAQFIAYMNSIGARYIVQDLDKVTGQVPPDDELNTFVARNAGSLALLYSNPWFKLFKLEVTPSKQSS